ncbi:iron complex transport system substrate-binding protein [Arenibacter nanhaiticus]|uniref:Iron complex transport system substrate-binding protein n=1 Tax=Arenibacter nanhaiticus TaxID=558155 RepID=A0A1M6EEI2_9FLAO|nr:ABC transporter substrate-binding protein [Arenibacter nanhaiticus]SHI83708.1 iron complex transport system substrate-binding protein [Arenibacter nanhaiticus]
MLKVCSFLPAVTQMLYDMGLEDHLFGITFECPQQALQEKLPVVRCVMEGKNLTSREIDTLFSESKHQGKSLYYVDEPVLKQIAPDIIFTQDICDVCQIDTECTAAAVAVLEKQPTIISISPESLEDVFRAAIVIGKALGQEGKAHAYLEALYRRRDRVIDNLRKHRAMPKRVMLMEWIHPIYNCGHWIPHQIAYAGGIDMLANPSGDSIVTSWEKIVKYDPEVLVIAPCGFTITRTMEEMHLLTQKPGWETLKAVKNNRVFLANFELFTQSSAGTLVDGIELLAGLFHPDINTIPPHLQHKYLQYYRTDTEKGLAK